MTELAGRIALVIGGASGMGLASARLMAERGARVVIADRDGDRAEAAAQAIIASGGTAIAYQLDAAARSEMRALFAMLNHEFGVLHVLFDNVGTRGPDGFHVEPEQFDQTFDLNVKSQFFTTNLAVPLLARAAPHASIVYMASGAGLRFFGRSPLYAMSKAALLMMMRAFARDLGPRGIRVNALCPGPVDTPFPRQDGDEERYRTRVAQLEKEIPLGRIAQPGDAAELVAFLASDRASYLTGLALPVDGGLFA